MKAKKWLLPVIIAAAVLVIAVYSVVTSIAKKPTVTQAQFPFSITYELDGETITINEVYSVRYNKNGGYTNTKTRYYVGKIGDMAEDTTVYTLKNDENGRIELWTYLYADYLMGDPEYDYFDDKAFEPRIYYYDVEENFYEDEETLLNQGVKLVSYEYPTPIENSFVFSHISILDSHVVFPSLLISLLALIAIFIFFKRDKTIAPKTTDIVSTVFNFLICIIALPIFTICAIFFDIMGDNEHIVNQTFYFLPALTILATAASVALRRKGHSKTALVVEFIGPVAFVALLIISAFQEIL